MDLTKPLLLLSYCLTLAVSPAQQQVAKDAKIKVTLRPNTNHSESFYIDSKGKKAFNAFRHQNGGEVIEGVSCIQYSHTYSLFKDVNGKVLLESDHENNIMFGLFKERNHPSDYLPSWEDDLIVCTNTDTRKMGYVDKTGKTALDFKYIAATRMKDGLAWVSSSNLYSKSRTYQLINKTGKVIKTLPENHYPHTFNNGFSLVASSEGSYYVNTKGEKVLPHIKATRNNFHEGIAVVRDGIINTKGEFIWKNDDKLWKVTLAEYNEHQKIASFGGLMMVTNLKTNDIHIKDAKTFKTLCTISTKDYAYIDLTGNQLISAFNKKTRKCGCFDKHGKVAIEFKYREPLYFHKGFCHTRQKGKDRFSYPIVLNLKGEVIWKGEGDIDY